MRYSRTTCNLRLWCRALLLLPCLVALPFSQLASAQEPWDKKPFTADAGDVLRAVQLLPLKGNPDIIGLLDEEKFTFQADGSCRHAKRRLYWVRTTEGTGAVSSYGVIWEPWHQNRPAFRARVITPDGAVHVLDPATVEDTNLRDQSSTIFSDRHFLRAPLPAIGAGSVVEVETVQEDITPAFAAGGIWRKYFSQEFPVRRTQLEIQYPPSLALRFKAISLPDLKILKTDVGGQTVLTFEQGPVEASGESEPLAPEEVLASPRVDFSTGSSWQKVATAYAKIIDRQLATEDVTLLARKVTEGKKTPLDIAQALLQYVHKEVRYTGVEFGESSFIPHTPQEVLKHRFGDCKDQATLLIALLRETGIPAYLAVLNTTAGEGVSRETPGLGQFDHAIVFVPGPSSLWIDVTSEFWSVGELPSEDQERLALVVSPQTTDLVSTPESSPADNQTVESREVTLAEFGPGRVHETTSYWGTAQAHARMQFAQESDPEVLNNNVRRYTKQAYGSESTTISISDPNDLAARFTIGIEVQNVKTAATDLNSAFVMLGPVQVTDGLPGIFREEISSGTSQPIKRKTELVLPAPYSYEVRYLIHAPAGFRPVSVPTDTDKHWGACLLTQRFSKTAEGIVTATIRFDTVKRRLSATEVDELRDGVQEFLRSDAAVVKFEQIGQANLEAGRIPEAFAEFKSLIKLHPKEGLHHVQLANALLAVGLGEAAREEAELATKLEPKSPLAYKTLGWIWQHDLVGRRFAKGFDRNRAIEAYRTAMDLDSGDASIPIDLAILLEHDGTGVRYSPAADLLEAIKLYRSVKDKLDLYEVGDNLVISLFWARQFAELGDELKDLPSTPYHDALSLASIAASHGSASAIDHAKSLGVDDRKGSEALAAAAQLLLQLRFYPEAADLLVASARASNDFANVRARAENIRRTRRHEEMALLDSDPRSVVFRFMTIIMGNGDPNEVFNLYSRYSVKQEDKKRLTDELRQTMRQIQASFQNTGIPRGTMIDLVLSMSDVNVQGNEQDGYSVGMRTSGDKPELFFVTKEEGQYKLLANYGPDDPGGIYTIGSFILELARRNDLRAARIWLDRIRDVTPAGGGDDPLAGPLFPRFWTKGQEGDTLAIRYAAAALMVFAKDGDAAPILLDGRARATSPNEITKFDLALATAYALSRRFTDLLPVTTRLLAANPKSDIALTFHASALRALEHYDEWEQVLQSRLQQTPDDADLIRNLAAVDVAQGQPRKAIEHYAAIISTGKATASDLNNFAWYHLVANDTSALALDAAERSAQLTNRNRGFVLHTLACLYAELGRTMEARDLLLKDMELEGMEEPDSNVWYGFGRIAEHYGLSEAAMAAYRRVEMPEDRISLPDSTYTLAQRRLAVMRSDSGSESR